MFAEVNEEDKGNVRVRSFECVYRSERPHVYWVISYDMVARHNDIFSCPFVDF